MQQYDIIIAGSGAAGLSLAYYLSLSPVLKNQKILLIDKDLKNQNDRTWGFWTKTPVAFDPVVSFRFNEAEFISRNFTAVLQLAPYQYQVLEGLRFYNFVREHIKQFPYIRFVQDQISSLEPVSEGAIVKTPTAEYRAKWVFNSCFLNDELKTAAKNSLFLLQHFKGWVIKTPKPAFNPNLLRLFDFRTPQQGQMRFFYLIPQAPDRALVEFTIFSAQLLEPEAYKGALKEYILNVLQLHEYEIVDEEWGVIPMTTYTFPPQKGAHIINIGSLAGASKPSTGYTFLRIQEQCRRIVSSLDQGKNPVVSFGAPGRFRLYDQMLLNIMAKKGALSEKIFSRLFKKNSTGLILKFLDENTSLPEEIMIMNSVPRVPFINSFLNLKAGLPFIRSKDSH